ncbi:MAG: alpha/beta fold hydrolase [Actinomycetota bacterium]
MTTLEDRASFARSFDGTMIAVRDMGTGDLPLLIVTAVGAGLSVWGRSLDLIVPERRVVSWDLRGLFESDPPVSKRIDPGAHVLDAMAAVRSLRIRRFHVAAWSSGGRIALELAAEYPERVASLSLVNAGYGYSLGRLLRLDLAALLPTAAGIARRFAAPLQGAIRGLVARPEIAGLARQSGMTAASADTASLVALLRGMAECDTGSLLATYQAVAGDPAPELAARVAAPTLVIAGEHDQFVARDVTEELVATLKDVRLETYEEATHYLPIEHPRALAADLRSFIAQAEGD